MGGLYLDFYQVGIYTIPAFLAQLGFWVLLLLSAPFVAIPLLEHSAVEHMKSPSGRWLFQMLYRLGWIALACHPKIGNEILSDEPLKKMLAHRGQLSLA